MSGYTKVSLVALLSGVLLLAGCTSREYEDLQSFMDEVRARPKGNIPPIPIVKPYEAFTYSASGLRSPFIAPVAVADKDEQQESSVKPDFNRPKQYLENFGIETFLMVGSISNDDGFWALISGGGGVHRVKEGDYLGRNHGKIISISETEIRVTEIVPSGKDKWVERPRTIALDEG
ncbi:pilus assembly protein PilP [Zooshikella ganghwensis]|uniref:Pilus assembly protein PilP n=1 Tax=Zooshikella ganghwensis TaxID=202772 RepID=A0A4P9VRP1_9GAMM|nr:pilus assembly protein PilP [Zooshikella ganghwensis]RDH46275.1 pilus assembly protein PilP [Zooshikella ganghwensis]